MGGRNSKPSENSSENSSESGIDHDRTPIRPEDMPLTPRQMNFLLKVVAAIPRLFAILEEGNVKSELILGLRRVRRRQARLKLVAELIDPGANPLKTHGAHGGETRAGRDTEPDTEPGTKIDQARSSN